VNSASVRPPAASISAASSSMAASGQLGAVGLGSFTAQ
jgi:hypothetical protein